MNNRSFTLSRLGDGPHMWRRAIHLGWTEAGRGAGWNRAYDWMSIQEQIGYEVGRLHRTNVMAAGIDVPEWRGSKVGASEVERAMGIAESKVGQCVP